MYQNLQIADDNARQIRNDIVLSAVREVAMVVGYNEKIRLNMMPFLVNQLLPQANIDNSIQSNVVNSQPNNKEEFTIMQQIKNIKNVRVRADGRFEWRKMINGVPHQIINRDPQVLIQRLSQYKKELKKNANANKLAKHKESLSLIDRIKIYFERNIRTQVRTGVLKPSSMEKYEQAIKKLTVFKDDIRHYTKDMIIDFFNGLRQHRTGAYCFYLLKRVFADEQEKGTIRLNPIATLKNPFPAKRCVTKGSWIDLKGQRAIRDHINDGILSKEILFYLVTGCRLREAWNTEIDFEKCVAKIKRDKTEKYGMAQTVVPLAKKFCEFIKDDWHKMFKIQPCQKSKQIVTFLKSLKINGKTTHSLRHTFSSNLYYLGIDPKRHQYLMGHSSIEQTYDTYTTLDMSVTKDDIVNIWDDFYPTSYWFMAGSEGIEPSPKVLETSVLPLN